MKCDLAYQYALKHHLLANGKINIQSSPLVFQPQIFLMTIFDSKLANSLVNQISSFFYESLAFIVLKFYSEQQENMEIMQQVCVQIIELFWRLMLI